MNTNGMTIENEQREREKRANHSEKRKGSLFLFVFKTINVSFFHFENVFAASALRVPCVVVRNTHRLREKWIWCVLSLSKVKMLVWMDGWMLTVFFHCYCLHRLFWLRRLLRISFLFSVLLLSRRRRRVVRRNWDVMWRYGNSLTQQRRFVSILFFYLILSSFVGTWQCTNDTSSSFFSVLFREP